MTPSCPAGQPPSLPSPPNLPECISHPCRSRREIRISLISGTLSVYAWNPGTSTPGRLSSWLRGTLNARLLLSGVLDRWGGWSYRVDGAEVAWCLKASPAGARTGAHPPVFVDRSLRPNGPGDSSPGLRPEADALGKGAP